MLTITQCQTGTSLMKDSPVSDSSDCTRLTSNLLPVNSNPISDHEVKEVTESCQQCYSVFGLTSENHSTHSHTKHHPAFRAGTLLSVCESHGRLVTRFKYTCGESQSNFRLCSSSWISLLQRHNCEAYRRAKLSNIVILSLQCKHYKHKLSSLPNTLIMSALLNTWRDWSQQIQIRWFAKYGTNQSNNIAN